MLSGLSTCSVKYQFKTARALCMQHIEDNAWALLYAEFCWLLLHSDAVSFVLSLRLPVSLKPLNVEPFARYSIWLLIYTALNTR